MKVLGVSSNYHDASAAIVVDGKVVAASAEERFTLQKHDSSFPQFSIQFCLDRAGLKAGDLDAVFYHEEPSIKTSRTLASALVGFPFSFPTFSRSMHDAAAQSFWLRNDLSSSVKIDPAKVHFVPHHLSHAAHAFFCSGYEEALCLTLDAVGEWTSSGIFRASRKGKAPFVEPLALTPFPHSLGLFYSAFTAYLGFKVNDEECSLMALATFGRPRFAPQVREVLGAGNDSDFYKIDLSYFDFRSDDDLPLTQKFLDAFGQPRFFKDSLPFSSLGDRTEVSAKAQHYADVAASVQLVLEEKVLEIAEKARGMTDSRNLCLAGGVSLNCVANGKLLQAGLFDNIFIPPDPGDGGGAMGAALLGYALLSGKAPVQRDFSAYYGQSYDNADINEIYENSSYRKKFARIRCATDEELWEKTASLLADGKIVGWVQGRFENGPRALGNRSILADPARLDVAKRLSENVKKRAPFRPYACSLPPETASQVFGPLSDSEMRSLRWMQFALPVDAAAQEPIRATLHVDGTTRPQVCFPDDNPRFHGLLRKFAEKTGRPGLLNTSFNASGMPLVASPVEAFLHFVTTDLDALVTDREIFLREARAT